MDTPRTARDIALSLVGETAAEVAEIALDQMLEEGVLKDMPLVGTVVRWASAGKSAYDALLLAKFFAFARNVEHATPEERAAWLARLEKNGQREQLQRSLLLLLEKMDDEEKGPLLGRAFTAHVKGGLTFRQFQRYAEIILGSNVVHLRILYSLRAQRNAAPIQVEVGRPLERFGLLTPAPPPSGAFTVAGEPNPRLDEATMYITDYGRRFVELVIRPEDME